MEVLPVPLPPRRARQRQALHHIRQVFFIAEPDFFRMDGCFVGVGILRLFRQRPKFVPYGETFQPVLPLPDSDRAGGVIFFGCRPDAHGGGHSQKHPVTGVPQRRAHLRRRSHAQQFSPVHHGSSGGQGKGVLQPVFRQDNGSPQLPVDSAQHSQKIRGGDGVQLAGGFVQDKDGGLHCHDGGQVEQLLLSAGQLGHVLIKPCLDTEKGRHLRHPAADGGRVVPQAFQPKSQLVPHLVCDDLVLRGLLDEADPPRLLPLVQLVQRPALKENLSGPPAVRGHDGLELPQQSRLAAPGGAAEDQELSPLYRQG